MPHKEENISTLVGYGGRQRSQFSLSTRKELRKQLARLASDADMTMRAFIVTMSTSPLSSWSRARRNGCRLISDGSGN